MALIHYKRILKVNSLNVATKVMSASRFDIFGTVVFEGDLV